MAYRWDPATDHDETTAFRIRVEGAEYNQHPGAMQRTFEDEFQIRETMAATALLRFVHCEWPEMLDGKQPFTISVAPEAA